MQSIEQIVAAKMARQAPDWGNVYAREFLRQWEMAASSRRDSVKASPPSGRMVHLPCNAVSISGWEERLREWSDVLKTEHIKRLASIYGTGRGRKTINYAEIYGQLLHPRPREFVVATKELMFIRIQEAIQTYHVRH